MTPKRTNNLATILAIAGLLVGGSGLFLTITTQNELATARATDEAWSDQAQTALNRVGTASLGPAHETDVDHVAHHPTDLPSPITRTEPTTVQYTVTFQELTAQLADGATYDFWTFDGAVPGPMLRVMEGDTVELTVVNPASNKVSHNIDLHAVNGPGGGAAVTNVAPGESTTVTFKALNPGLYAYHCAFAPPMHHVAQGMYGAILVEPKGGLPEVDREFYVMQGEWYTTGKMGDQGHQLFSGEKALAENPEYFTFNGNVNALTKLYPLEARVGETVRVFFGVGGPNIGSNFHIIGEIFDRVYSGSPETYIANEETWYVPPGSAAIFEMTLNEPGSYTLVDHALYRVLKGAAGVLTVTGDWDPAIYMPPADGASH